MKTTKTLYILLIGVLVIVAFQACESDPAFPDPGFELTDTRVEIRRDTADYYDINLKMSVPNGVETIDLIDATNYNVLSAINDYNGKTNFNFDYRVDLTPFEKDTVLNYIVKVVDTDNRSFNRGIRISVKGFSYPEVKLVGGNNVAVVAPAYYVKGIVSTGLNTIGTVKIIFEGEEQYSFEADPTSPLSEMVLKQLVFLGSMEAGITYNIDIMVTDSAGQSSTTTIAVTKGQDITRPIQINYVNSSGALITVKFEYDTEENMTAFDYLFSTNGYNYRHEFSYNTLKMVDTIFYRLIKSDGTYTDDKYNYINYEAGTKKITNIESQSIEYEGGNVIVGDIAVEADNFVYNDATGAILSFDTSSTVNNIYYSDPFGLGEQIFGEYWQLQSYMTRNDRRQHRSEYDPVIMPTYTEGMPPVLFTSSGVFDFSNEMFLNKYIMTKTAATASSPSSLIRLPSYTYETDNQGKITKITRVFTSSSSAGNTETFTFFYDE
ncbi:MAG: hypothetical protein ACK5NB_10835 [Flavobacteriaceae bacterium]